MTKITAIDGISQANANKLAKAGVTSVEGLLEAGATGKGRAALVEQTKIKEELISAWVNRADLLRVKGVASQSAAALEMAGIMTVGDLSKSKAPKLVQAIGDALSKSKKKDKPSLPSEKSVEKWIMAAKELPKVVKK